MDKLLEKNLTKYIKDNKNNGKTILYGNHGKVVVEKKRNMLVFKTIDIEPKYRGRGIYKSLEKISYKLSCLNKYHGIFIEDVLNSQFLNYFLNGVKKNEWIGYLNGKEFKQIPEHYYKLTRTDLMTQNFSFYKLCK